MSTERRSTVFIILPVHNRRETTRGFSERLMKQSRGDFVLVLVDDGSTDGTLEMVREYPFRREICRGDGSLWWAGGLRRGMSRLAAVSPAADDVVLWANDDTQLPPDFLEKAVAELAAKGPGVILAVPTVFTDSGRRDEGCFVSDWPHFRFRDYGSHPERIDCASTRCLLIRYADLQRCGRFRPRLLPHYLSDFEFTIRACRRGIRILPARSVTCSSTEGSTGFQSMSGTSAREILARMFSPKYAANPLSMFMFILLAAPLQWKIACWTRALRTFVAAFVLTTIVRRLGRPHTST